MKIIFRISVVLLFISVPFAQAQNRPEGKQEFTVNFERFRLDNGLQVILHVDKSDPVVAVALTAHVGSAREIEGRTGFAHLFEHLLFLESENLGKGGLDKMSARIGGSGANGSTSRDRTNYYQTVPNDALEKMIWAEADKLGFFINTVTDPVLAKEKQVVKNEKRQSYDNQPYGQTSYVTDRALYPASHPYHWQVIGSLEDLQNATLDDVKGFYRRWYVPNNVMLVIAGDFDPAQAKAWVTQYFSEIKRGEEVLPLKKMPVTLSQTASLYHEDNFAQLPELTYTWPGVYRYHPDAYALDFLVRYLTTGKKAPFYRVLTEEKKLTDRTSFSNDGSELAGELSLSVRAYENKKLDDVAAAITEAFALFEKEGISEEDLQRIKAEAEVNFYTGLSSVLGKAFQLAQYEIFAGDAGYINKDIKNILLVTREDVMRVYNQYIKGKNHIATSFVPKGHPELVLSGSVKAEITEEKIVQGAEQEVDPGKNAVYERTPSSFDRPQEPPYGKSPELKMPAIWESRLRNSLHVIGTQQDETPIVQFNLRLKGGLLLEDPSKTGVSNLLAETIIKGTKNKTPEELEKAIKKLGTTLTARAGEEEFIISGTTLARNYDATMELLQEIILEPRWDEKELELARERISSRLKQQKGSPVAIADGEFRRLIYGNDHILSRNTLGTEASLSSITMDDLKRYHGRFFSPSVADLHIAGAITQKDAITPLNRLGTAWKPVSVSIPSYPAPPVPEKATIYFYDMPGAKQSVLRFGAPALRYTDPDYYPAIIMNYILGGGGFASRLTQQLREGKGYTYGINSSFDGGINPGAFRIATSVRSNVTFESAKLIREILLDYGSTFSQQDLEVTQSFLQKSSVRSFETLGAKIELLKNITTYHLPHDYIRQRENIITSMTIPRIRMLAGKYLDSSRMFYLVVGDAATQLARLEDLGLGKPVLLNAR